MHLGETGIRNRELRIEPDSLGQIRHGLFLLGAHQILRRVQIAAQERLIRVQVLRRQRRKRRRRFRRQRDIEHTGHVERDALLHREHLARSDRRRDLVGPELRTRRDVDETRCDENQPRAVGPAVGSHAAREDMRDPELGGDLAQRLLAQIVLHGAGARHHTNAVHIADARRQLVGDAVGEILLVGWALVIEREHSDDRRCHGGGGVAAPRDEPAGDDRNDDERRANCHKTPSTFRQSLPQRRRTRGDAAERAHERIDARESLRRVFRQRNRERVRDVRRNISAQLTNVRNRRRVVKREHRERGQSHERRPAREHLEQNARETVLIARRPDRRAPDPLLGAHVGRRADGDSRLRQLVLRRVIDQPRDAEIGDHRDVAG